MGVTATFLFMKDHDAWLTFEAVGFLDAVYGAFKRRHWHGFCFWGIE
ncbi:hypothetical protein ACMZ4W_00389 [Brevundimonas naejangsanensis]